MKVLIDTHSFLWLSSDDPRLSSSAKRILEDPTNVVLLSIDSLWEIAIKFSIGKLTLKQPLEVIIAEELGNNNINLLNIELDHILAVSILPLHHRDPFDRMLIAQATVEGIPIISADTVFDSYGISRLW